MTEKTNTNKVRLHNSPNIFLNALLCIFFAAAGIEGAQNSGGSLGTPRTSQARVAGTNARGEPSSSSGPSNNIVPPLNLSQGRPDLSIFQQRSLFSIDNYFNDQQFNNDEFAKRFLGLIESILSSENKATIKRIFFKEQEDSSSYLETLKKNFQPFKEKFRYIETANKRKIKLEEKENFESIILSSVEKSKEIRELLNTDMDPKDKQTLHLIIQMMESYSVKLVNSYVPDKNAIIQNISAFAPLQQLTVACAKMLDAYCRNKSGKNSGTYKMRLEIAFNSLLSLYNEYKKESKFNYSTSGDGGLYKKSIDNFDFNGIIDGIKEYYKKHKIFLPTGLSLGQSAPVLLIDFKSKELLGYFDRNFLTERDRNGKANILSNQGSIKKLTTNPNYTSKDYLILTDLDEINEQLNAGKFNGKFNKLVSAQSSNNELLFANYDLLYETFRLLSSTVDPSNNSGFKEYLDDHLTRGKKEGFNFKDEKGKLAKKRINFSESEALVAFLTARSVLKFANSVLVNSKYLEFKDTDGFNNEMSSDQFNFVTKCILKSIFNLNQYFIPFDVTVNKPIRQIRLEVEEDLRSVRNEMILIQAFDQMMHPMLASLILKTNVETGYIDHIKAELKSKVRQYVEKDSRVIGKLIQNPDEFLPLFDKFLDDPVNFENKFTFSENFNDTFEGFYTDREEQVHFVNSVTDIVDQQEYIGSIGDEDLFVADMADDDSNNRSDRRSTDSDSEGNTSGRRNPNLSQAEAEAAAPPATSPARASGSSSELQPTAATGGTSRSPEAALSTRTAEAVEARRMAEADAEARRIAEAEKAKAEAEKRKRLEKIEAEAEAAAKAAAEAEKAKAAAEARRMAEADAEARRIAEAEKAKAAAEAAAKATKKPLEVVIPASPTASSRQVPPGPKPQTPPAIGGVASSSQPPTGPKPQTPPAIGGVASSSQPPQVPTEIKKNSPRNQS